MPRRSEAAPFVRRSMLRSSARRGKIKFMDVTARRGKAWSSECLTARTAGRVPVLLALGLLAVQGQAASGEPGTSKETSPGAAATGASTGPAAAQEPVPAVWKARELYFSYSSSTAIYSCSALAGRVAGIFREVGARDDIKVRVNDCSEAIVPTDDAVVNDRMSRNSSQALADHYLNRKTDPRQYVHVYVHMMIPTQVTPQVLEELKKDKSRRELVAHVTGNPAARFNDPIMFAAEWQPVTLSHKTIGLEPEDCELIDQMSPTVFREIGVRPVHEGFSCSPNSHIAPELVLEALLVSEKGMGRAPAAAGEEGDDSVPANSGDKRAEPATKQPATEKEPATDKTPD
jgi:hypothetical protein